MWRKVKVSYYIFSLDPISIRVTQSIILPNYPQYYYIVHHITKFSIPLMELLTLLRTPLNANEPYGNRPNMVVER